MITIDPFMKQWRGPVQECPILTLFVRRLGGPYRRPRFILPPLQSSRRKGSTMPGKSSWIVSHKTFSPMPKYSCTTKLRMARMSAYGISGLRAQTSSGTVEKGRQRRSHCSEGSTYPRVRLSLLTACGLAGRPF